MSSFKSKRLGHIKSQMTSKKRLRKCHYCAVSISGKNACHLCKAIQPDAKNIIPRKQPRNIKRVFVLTLTGKESRLDFFKKRTLSYLGDYDCFPYIGVDGRKVEDVRKLLDYFYSNDTISINKIMGYRMRHPGSIGCHLSHMSMWNYIYTSMKEEEQYALILEDDATFEPYGIENIEIAIDRLMYLDWDILYFGHSPKLKGSNLYPNVLSHVKHSFPEKRTNCGFWGYAVKISSIPKLIQSVMNFETMSIDATIQYYFGKTVNPLFMVKPFVKQSSGYSVRMIIEKDGIR